MEEENLKTRKQLKFEQSKNQKLKSQIQILQVENEKNSKELISFRKHGESISATDFVGKQKRILDLENEIHSCLTKLAEKEALIESLLNPTEGAQSHILAENRRLKRDLELWMNRTSKLTQELAVRDTPMGEKEYISKKVVDLEKENASLKSNSYLFSLHVFINR